MLVKILREHPLQEPRNQALSAGAKNEIIVKSNNERTNKFKPHTHK